MNIKSDNVCHTLGKLLVLDRLEFPSLLVPLIFHPGGQGLKPWLLWWFISEWTKRCPESWDRTVSGCVCQGVSRGAWHVSQQTEGKICTQCWQAPRRKRQRENFFSLSFSSEGRALLFSCPWTSELQNPQPLDSRTYTSNLPHYPLVLKPSVLD